ncbi:MAG: endonuclease III, partial [Acetobacteraceae bacterium]
MASDRPEPATRPIGAAAVRGFIAALAAANPDPRSELRFADHFTLLVAVVLSAQTTDKAVNL